MRARPAARLLVLDPAGRILLFRFAYREGALAGLIFWATPGGELEPGETFEDGARRELIEETGLAIDDPGPQVERRQFELRLPDGEMVLADERYFVIRVSELTVSDAGWTDLERDVMGEHRWWTRQELRAADEQIFPLNLAGLLERLDVTEGQPWPTASSTP